MHGGKFATPVSKSREHLKICMITQSFYAADPRVRREAETAVSNGSQVDVICLKKRGQSSQFRLNGVNVYGVSLAKRRGRPFRYLFEYFAFFICASFMLTFLFLRKRYQLVQVHTLPDLLVFSAAIPRLFGARTILDMHEVMPEFFASKFKLSNDHLFIRILIFFERISAKFANSIITVNDPIKELLASRSIAPEKITVVMNSVDERLFGGAKTAWSENQDRSEFKIMYHGTLTEIYGLDIAIRALQLIREKLPAASFHIFGEGPIQDDLARLADQLGLGDRVIFHGRIPLETIPDYIKGCDLGLLPTRQDEFLDLSLSNKLVEYIYMGKPVVASRLATTRKYFRESSISYFAPHDHADLAKQVLSLVTDPQKAPAQISSALQDYQNINWEVMSARYLDLLDRLSRSAE
jgi:glycosyltransferase involved in cell wall biosynthesis